MIEAQEDIREQIIYTTKEILIKQGLKEINIRKISKQCYIGVGTFYYYFEDKQEALLSVFRHDWQKVIEQCEQLEEEDIPFKEKLRMISLSVEGFSHQYLDVFYELANRMRQRSCMEQDKFEQLEESVARMIEREKQLGQMHNDTDALVLARFVLFNMMKIHEHRVGFDQLYDCLNLYG